MESLNLIERSYRRLTAEGRKILKLYSGNPTEQGFRFPSGILEKVYSQYFREQKYHPHPKGLPVARRAIQQYYKEGGAEVDAEHVILTSGSSESFLYLFSLLGKNGGKFLTPQPAYPLFNHIAELAGVELRHYALREEKSWDIDLEDLRIKTDAATRAIILVSPNNPTGAVHSPSEIEEVVTWANQKGIALICDEVFSEFYFGEGKFPRPMAVSKPKLCFTLNGISKMFALPGLKLSWIAVTGEDSKVESAVDHLETMADTFLTCHLPIQEALPEIFSKGQDFLRAYQTEVGRRRRLAMELLNQCSHITVVEPSGGFYLMGKIQKEMGLSEEEFVIRLMEEKGVFVHPGYFYDYEEGVHFVLSFLTEEEELVAGIGGLVDFVENL